MPRKSKPKMTTPPTIYTIPFTEPFTEPVSQPLQIPPPPPLSEPEEERQYWLRKNMALDGLLMEPVAPQTNSPTPAMKPSDAPLTVEYSLADLAGEQESSREQIQSQPAPVPQAAPHPVTSAPPPATAIPAEQGSILPRITRHRGQTVQTFKAIYVMTPIQYRAAFDKLKKRTRRTGKEVLCEAIADCAVKHGLVSKPDAIMGWPDWD